MGAVNPRPLDSGHAAAVASALPERTMGQVFNGLEARREGGHGKEGDEVSSVGRGEDVGRDAPRGEEDTESERGRKTWQAGV